MNFRFLLVAPFFLSSMLSAAAVENDGGKDEYLLAIVSALSPRKTSHNGLIVVSNPEDGKRLIKIQKQINLELKKYFPNGCQDIKLKMPKRKRPARPGNDPEPFPVVCFAPSCITEVMLAEVIRDKCPCLIVMFFRDAYNASWLLFVDKIALLINDINTFPLPDCDQGEASEPIELNYSILQFEQCGFNVDALKVSQHDADIFSKNWNVFKNRNDLEKLKEEWLTSQRLEAHAFCNAQGLNELEISEPKLLSDNRLHFDLNCTSLQQAIAFHRKVDELGFHRYEQKVFSEIRANFNAKKIVVGDDRAKKFITFTGERFQFLAAPVSKEKMQLVEDIIHSQRSFQLTCHVGNKSEVHEVIILGAPTMKELTETLSIYFPESSFRFIDKNLCNNTSLDDFVQIGLEVKLDFGLSAK